MKRLSTRWLVVLAFVLAAGLAVLASPYASSSPDGLEKVAEAKGFADEGRLHTIQDRSPVPDYAFPGIEDPRLATSLAGLVGVLAVTTVAVVVASVLRRRRAVPAP